MLDIVKGTCAAIIVSIPILFLTEDMNLAITAALITGMIVAATNTHD